MKHRIRPADLALLALLLAGCTETKGPAGLGIELRTERSVLAPGDTFRAVFTVRNTTLGTVRTQFGAIPRYDVVVSDARDSVVMHSPWACFHRVNELVLGPLGSESYDVSFIIRNSDGSPAAWSGDYLVRARLSGFDEPHRDLSVHIE